MKLIAERDGNSHEVEIVRNGRSVTAKVDGREYTLDAAELEDGVFLLKHDAAVYEAMVGKAPDSGFYVQLRGSSHEVNIIDPKRLRGSAGAEGDGSGMAEIKTAMPGKVVRLLKAEGDAVEKGEGVVVVEAMKMQNEMKAPKDGSISRILFTEGDTVAAGDVLVVIE